MYNAPLPWAIKPLFAVMAFSAVYCYRSGQDLIRWGTGRSQDQTSTRLLRSRVVERPFPAPSAAATPGAGIKYSSEHRYFGFSRPDMMPLIEAGDYVWGQVPQVLHAQPQDAIIPGMPVPFKVDVLEHEHHRFNPSLIRIPAHLGLAEYGAYLMVDRYSCSSPILEDDDPRDFLPATKTWSSDKGLRREEGKCQAAAELVLLDDKMNTLARTRVEGEPQLHGRLLVLKEQLFLYSTRYHDPATGAFRSALRPLHLEVVASQGGKLVEMRASVDTIGHPDYIDMDMLTEDGLTRGAVGGKNHIFFEREDGQVYILNYLIPLAIARLVDNTRIHMEPTAAPAMDGLAHPLAHMRKLHLNGGKLIYLPERGEFLGMGHKSYNLDPKSGKHGTSHYVQFFFTLSAEAPFHISSVSPMFCFPSHGRPDDCDAIQFVGNVELVEGRLVIPYGVNDAEPYVYSMTLERALGMLQEVGPGAQEQVAFDART